MDESEFPSNSNAKNSPPKAKAKPEKKVHRVTTSEVTTRKKSVGSRFKEIFIGDDSRSVGEYVLLDVIIPAAKDMIADAVSQGVERKLFGDSRRRSGGRPASATGPFGHVSYDRISSNKNASRASEPRVLGGGRRGGLVNDLVVGSRAEATEIIDTLGELIDLYEVATVSDLLEMVGHTGSYTDERFGWTDIRGFDVRRDRGGSYVIIVPRASAID